MITYKPENIENICFLSFISISTDKMSQEKLVLSPNSVYLELEIRCILLTIVGNEFPHTENKVLFYFCVLYRRDNIVIIQK